MYMGPSPLSDVYTLQFSLITSGEGPAYLQIIVKGQIMAFRQIHIEKTTYLDNLNT